MPQHPLIFVTRRPPFPLDNGARIRAQRLAQFLSERFDLTLVTFADGPVHDETRATRADLEAVLPGARIELVPYGQPLPGGLRRNAPRRGSADWAAYDTPTMRAALARLTPAGAVLHLDDPGVGLAGLGVDAAVKTFAPHNVEHRIVRGVAHGRPWRDRVFLELEWRKVRAEELRLWRACDISVAVSDVDAEAMREGGARRVEVCPNGTDAVEPFPLHAASTDAPLRLLFVGSGNFWPYELGLRWFVEGVMPLAREDGPVSFDVVGAPPNQPVQAPDVRYLGRVPEVASHYEAAHALVIPIFQGSGTRLKVIEAAAMGRPIVSTALGVEGLPLQAGVHYLRAEDEAQFAAAIADLRTALTDRRDEVAAMCARAREACEPYTWPRLAHALADVYESALD